MNEYSQVIRLCVGLTLLTFSSGCSLLYDHSVDGDHYVIYSNRGEEFTAKVDGVVQEIYASYQTLFKIDESELGTTKILLDGEDDGVVDHAYTPNLLGYYVPMFNFIRIDTEPVWAQDEDSLTQVLLHEIAHHFLVTKYPVVADQCWLNEGLAGNLEVTRVEDGAVEHPLLHPVLVRLAQKHVRQNAGISARDLIEMSWSEFHSSERKIAHYALSWSLVYFLLEVDASRSLPLGERIERLVEMPADQIVAREHAWKEFLNSFDLTNELIALAETNTGGQPLTSRWAIRQMGELYSLDDVRVLRSLARLVEHAEGSQHAQSCHAFLRVAQRNPHAHYVASETSKKSLAAITRLVESGGDEAIAERVKLIAAIDATTPEREKWIRVLVTLLNHHSPAIRATSAEALGRIGAKPTIVSPHFWQLAPATAREREVGEWETYLRRAKEVREKRD